MPQETCPKKSEGLSHSAGKRPASRCSREDRDSRGMQYAAAKSVDKYNIRRKVYKEAGGKETEAGRKISGRKHENPLFYLTIIYHMI